MKQRFYDKVRGIFKKHYSCAFRTDFDISTLDCLTYMAEEIEDLHNDLIEKERQEERAAIVDTYKQATGIKDDIFIRSLTFGTKMQNRGKEILRIARKYGIHELKLIEAVDEINALPKVWEDTPESENDHS